MRLYWTDEENQKILKNKIAEETWASFAAREMPHRTADAVRLHAIRYMGIKNSVATCRQHFFKKDRWKEQTPESCYWAGFLAADGCLIEYSPGRFSLALELQKSDQDVLKRFSDFCEYSGPLQKERLKKLKNKDGFSITKSIRINCGTEWLEDLKNNFSIVPRKTHILQPPHIEDTFLIYCFLIGYIDGDGCIHRVESRNSVSLTVVSCSKEMGKWVQSHLDFLADGSQIKNKIRNGCAESRTYHTAFLNGNPACAVIDYLRNFPVPKLDRKWNSPEVISYIESQKSLYPEKFLSFP